MGGKVNGGDRDGMLAIATGSQVESSSLLFLLHVSLLLSLFKETSTVCVSNLFRMLYAFLVSSLSSFKKFCVCFHFIK